MHRSRLLALANTLASVCWPCGVGSRRIKNNEIPAQDGRVWSAGPRCSSNCRCTPHALATINARGKRLHYSAFCGCVSIISNGWPLTWAGRSNPMCWKPLRARACLFKPTNRTHTAPHQLLVE
uniref:Putative secreted protein n=1 Tax=Anopheles darlingi TaxID=43151 RepID=A0A2M4DJ16_ANODA